MTFSENFGTFGGRSCLPLRSQRHPLGYAGFSGHRPQRAPDRVPGPRWMGQRRAVGTADLAELRTPSTPKQARREPQCLTQAHSV